MPSVQLVGAAAGTRVRVIRRSLLFVKLDFSRALTGGLLLCA